MSNWTYTTLALPQTVAAVACLLALVVTLRRRVSGRLAGSLAFMLASHLVWAGAGALEFCAHSLDTKTLLSQISYLGITAGPLALLHFTHAYIDDGALPPRRWRLLAGLLGALVLGLCWTNQTHRLLWSDVTQVEILGHPFAHYHRGPAFWLVVAYCYGFMLASSARLIRHTLRVGGIFSRQSLLILAATLAPWLTSLAYVLRLGPAPELDHTPVGFALSSVLLTLGVTRLRLFEVSHVPADVLFARVPDPVLVIGAGGRLLRANSAAIEQLGASPARFGEPLAETLPAAPGLAAVLLENPADTRWKTTREVAGVWWEIESGPAGASSPARLVLLRDITEQKTAERRLADALARAERLRGEADAANAAKSVFLAQVSHDLRTPLHAILGISDLLRAGQTDARIRADADTIHEAGHILLRLINDLLDLSRIESGRIDLAYEPFRLDEVLTPVVDLLAVKARTKQLTLTHSIDPALPAALCGDADRLRHILFNLAGNAVKFTSTGSITLAVTSSPEGLAFTVADTGPGIPADRLPTLFDPFDRGDAEAVQAIEGTGLGLAIARRITRAFGGDITVASRPGEGSVFTVNIPLLPSDADPEAPGLRRLHGPLPPSRRTGSAPPLPFTAQRPGDRALRVLLADDQEISRRVSGELLRACGCEVTIARDGAEALALLRVTPHDLAILDGQMRRLNGWDVARRLRSGEAGEAPRLLPILALTADLSPESRDLWRSAGVDQILAKPGGRDALQAALAKIPSVQTPPTHGNTPPPAEAASGIHPPPPPAQT